MDGHAKASALQGDVTEEEVLQELVGGWVGVGFPGELGVDAGGVGAAGVGEVEGTEVGDLELFGDGSAGVLALERGGDDLDEVLVERRRHVSQVDGGEVTGAELVFEREEESFVGVLGGERGVVEWKEERVGVGDPAEARGLDARAHQDAVGDHGADVRLVEHPLVEVEALAGFDGGARGFEAFHPVGVERDGQVDAPESLPGGGKLGVVGAPGDGVGLGLHVVDGEGVEVPVGSVGGWGQDWVGVVVDGGGGEDVGVEFGIEGAFESGLGVERRDGEEG